jgi:uncharacterized membrane protein
MLEMAIVALIAFIIFIFFWVVLFLAKKRKSKSPMYSCGSCDHSCGCSQDGS